MNDNKDFENLKNKEDASTGASNFSNEQNNLRLEDLLKLNQKQDKTKKEKVKPSKTDKKDKKQNNKQSDINTQSTDNASDFESDKATDDTNNNDKDLGFETNSTASWLKDTQKPEKEKTVLQDDVKESADELKLKNREERLKNIVLSDQYENKKQLEDLLKKEKRKVKDFERNDLLDVHERQIRQKLDTNAIKSRENDDKLIEYQDLNEKLKEQAQNANVADSNQPLKSIEDLIAATKGTAPKVSKINDIKAIKLSEKDELRLQQKLALEQEKVDLYKEKNDLANKLIVIEECRKEEDKRKKAGFLWFILIGFLAAMLGVLGYFIYITFRPVDPQLIQITVDMVNFEDVFTKPVIKNGQLILEPITVNPLDEFLLQIKAENVGDANDKDVYLRFRLFVAEKDNAGVDIEHEDMIDFTNIDFDSLWHKFDEEQEKGYKNIVGQPYVTSYDGYIYYKGILKKGESVVLTDTIKFTEILNEFGGRRVEIVVNVEAIDYFNVDIGSPTWETAPRAWVEYIGVLQDEMAKQGN